MGRIKILDDPHLPDRPTYPRRFPRMGSQFQARITKTAENLSRPPPDLMSSEYPHMSENEGDRNNEEGIDLFQDSEDHSNELEAPRGGLLLHAPSKDKVPFPQFVQPLIVSVEDVPPQSLANDAWKQHIIQVQNKESPKKRRRAQRGGVKRKSAPNDDDELVWGLESMLKKQDRKEPWPKLQVGEDDACALEYLHLQHNGNVEAAELNLLINLTAGQASKHRKCIEAKQLKKRKLSHLCSSESWRTMYERKGFVSILGRLQDEALNPYAMKQELLRSGLGFDSIDLSYDRDDLKGAWRSVLAWGKSIEQQLDECTTRAKKLPFSAVLSFVSNAYRLPPPESCFGTHHVMIEEVSNCLLAILGHIEKAREVQAEIRDKLYNESTEGIDSDALQKYVESRCKPLPIRLDEVHQICRFKEVVSEWEARLASVLEATGFDDISEEHDDLAIAERMAAEAKSHGYISKGLVQLNRRIQRAEDLRDRILRWKRSCAEGNKSTTRSMTALAKDGKRVKFLFPEVRDFLKFHYTIELWIDRANIAIRSRISLAEIRTLIQQGEELPLDLTDHIEKLKSRVAAAERWLQRLEQVVQCPKTDSGEPNLLQWTRYMRIALFEGNQGCLHELGSDGSRIPVDVDAVKLLQVELDAKNWTLKAQKWLPASEDSKKGKLADIREHVERALSLRERLTLSDIPKRNWVLDGEAELISIVSAADAWFEEYKPFLEGDNRRNQSRGCLSLAKLRKIVEEERSIFANIGNSASKISRILAQADSWYDEHQSLLIRCNLEPSGSKSPQSYVELAEMAKAVESAAADISLDLDEAGRLKQLVKKIRKWFDRVAIVAPQRSKRQSRISRSSFAIEDLLGLIEESSTFPVDVEKELKRLQIQLSAIQTWRLHASHELQQIGTGFVQLRESMNSAYGLPAEFSIDRFTKLVGWDGESNGYEQQNSKPAKTGGTVDNYETPADMVNVSTSDSTSLDGDSSIRPGTENGRSDVHRMIKELQEGAKGNGVVTVEAKIADLLERVSRWCLRSLKYLDSPREIYDKRFFGAFDRFIGEGNELLENHEDQQRKSAGTPYENLASTWSEMLSDQLERLKVLRSDRAKFIQWCEVANKVLSDEKKLTMEKLKDLAEKSRCFPAVSDLIHKVRGLSVKVATWVDEARKLYTSGKKLTMQDAKSLLEAGEKLKVNTQELRTLRASLRAARIWSNKVKRCNLDHGEIHVSTVNDLIEEHESFLIEMPDELSILEQTTQAYCICRRPYEGFMIGCDDCEEWYHGSCIGVSESRADRYEKYSCVRCSTKSVFRSSASGAIEIIKKWTSWKHLKKARQVEYQKHQRKVRKETKDVEKFRAILKSLEETEPNQAGLSENLQSSALVPQSEVSLGGLNAAVGDESAIPGLKTATLQGEPQKIQDTRAEREKATTAIQQAEECLQLLSEKNIERKQLEKDEDENASKLRRWCIRVRSLVLVPSEHEQCDKACPPLDGSLSTRMSSLISEAESFGISCLPDVDSMTNFFKCMSWSFFTLSIISRKPSFDEMKMLLSQAASAKLPDEKALKTMKVMFQRAIQWQGKIRKALAPRAGEIKPLNLSVLRELSAGVAGIALLIPEASKLNAAIEDRGTRHCLCGGPSDGSFMLACVKCKRKFHGTCVNEPNDLNPSVENWVCVRCSGQKYCEPIPLPKEEGSVDHKELECTNRHTKRGVSPHAPDPRKLWPPFPLFGSPEATEILGQECSLIPDDIGIIEFPAQMTEQHPRSTSGPSEIIGERALLVKSTVATIGPPHIDATSSQACFTSENSLNCDTPLCLSTELGLIKISLADTALSGVISNTNIGEGESAELRPEYRNLDNVNNAVEVEEESSTGREEADPPGGEMRGVKESISTEDLDVVGASEQKAQTPSCGEAGYKADVSLSTGRNEISISLDDAGSVEEKPISKLANNQEDSRQSREAQDDREHLEQARFGPYLTQNVTITSAAADFKIIVEPKTLISIEEDYHASEMKALTKTDNEHPALCHLESEAQAGSGST